MANVTAVPPRIEITASGGQDEFTWNFLVLDAPDLTVLHTPLATGVTVTLDLTTDYTINSGSLENESGGTITLTVGSFPTGAAAGDIITIIRDTEITRSATYTTAGFFPAQTVEREYTDIYLIMQENQREISRALFLPDGLTGAVSPWVAPTPKDGQALVWSGNDGTLRNSPFDLDDLLSTVAALQPTVQTLYFQVLSRDFSDSPIALTGGFDGTLFRVDTSGGNVVINLDTLSNYGKDIKFAFVKITPDANTITINRGGTDTFDAGATSLVVSAQNSVTDIIGQLSSGVWQSIVPFGGAAAVIDVFGRTGNVVAVASDYDASQVDNDSGVAGAFVDNALDTLDAAITAGDVDILGAEGTPIASAATTDIGAADSSYVSITGTTNISSFGSTMARNHIWGEFTGSLDLIHNGVSMILPNGGANITTAAGDTFEARRLSSGASDWIITNYQKADGTPLAGAGGAVLTQENTSAELTVTAGTQHIDAHGLGGQPKIIQLILRCKSAELGYSVNDEVYMNPAGDTSSANRALSNVVDATNVTVRIGSSGLGLARKDTGATAAITAANWRLLIRSFA